MEGQKICISKQTTFMVFIFLLLASYAVFAYWTTTNKTSTNSRASETKEIAKGVIPTGKPPSDDQFETLQRVNITRDIMGKIQIFGKPNLQLNKKYTIYAFIEGEWKHLKTVVTTKNTLRDLVSTFWQPAAKIDPEYVQNSDVYIYEVN